MSSDHYATLGVPPAAERGAISAAYRALMRHYHPDSNPDPEAHIRAQAITAAYAVLRDPAKRAKYDAELKDGDVWRWLEPPPRPARPPAARTAGIAAAVLSVLMVGAALLLPPPREQPTLRLGRTAAASQQANPEPAPTRPVIELEPEGQRLADLGGTSELQPPAVPPPEVPIQQVRAEPPPTPAPVVREAPAMPQVQAEPPPAPLRAVREARAPVPRAAKPPKPQSAVATRAPTPAAIAPAPKALADAKPAAPRRAPAAANSDRVETLQRISAGFYSQSLQHADAAKKELLLSVRVRQTYKRAMCRSDSCVADSYLRQIREVSAIMENRTLPGQ